MQKKKKQNVKINLEIHKIDILIFNKNIKKNISEKNSILHNINNLQKMYKFQKNYAVTLNNKIPIKKDL